MYCINIDLQHLGFEIPKILLKIFRTNTSKKDKRNDRHLKMTCVYIHIETSIHIQSKINDICISIVIYHFS